MLSCLASGGTVGRRTSILRASNLSSRRIAFRYPARMPCQMRFALRSTPTLIVIRMMMVTVAASSSAKAGIIAGMLAFVHTFTVGAVNFSAVGFSDIFVTLSCNRILIAVLVTMSVSAFIASLVRIRRVVSKSGDDGAAETDCANGQDQKSKNLREHLGSRREDYVPYSRHSFCGNPDYRACIFAPNRAATHHCWPDLPTSLADSRTSPDHRSSSGFHEPSRL
jgi:hypothetical protein